MKRIGLLALLVAAAIAGQAKAQTATGSLTVTTSVLPGCTVSTTAIAFAPYDPFAGSETTGVGTIAVSCAAGTPTTSIQLDDGQNFNGGMRRMQSSMPSGDFISYSIFQPSSSSPMAACVFPGTTPWTVASALPLTTALSSATRTFNVCGSIPAGQNASVNTYSDTVGVTVNF